jgi:hypothetical protein
VMGLSPMSSVLNKGHRAPFNHKRFQHSPTHQPVISTHLCGRGCEPRLDRPIDRLERALEVPRMP